MTIQFNTIPSGIRKPGKYFEFDASLATRGLALNPQKLLLIGQILSSALPPGGANVPEQITDSATAAAHYGAGSMLARMVTAALTAYSHADLWCLPVIDPAAGVAAAAVVASAGATAPTVAGTVTFTVAGKAYAQAVTTTTTVADILTALAAAITADPNAPVTATYGSGSLTITAKHKGALGNDLALSYDPAATGLIVTIPAMTSGAGSSDLTTALAAVFPSVYDVIVCPWNDSTTLQALRTHLNSAGDSIEQRGQLGISAVVGTVDAATSLADGLNAERISLAALEHTATPSPEVAAAYGAMVASETDPAMPLNGLDLVGILPPTTPYRFTRSEQETLLAGGVTPLEVGAGELVQIVRSITTYQLNSEGVADVAWLDITTMRTMDYTRKAILQRMTQRFGRCKKSARVKAQIRSEALDVLRKEEELEILENVEANKDMVFVEDDLQDANRVNLGIPADVVNGLHVLAGKIWLIL